MLSGVPTFIAFHDLEYLLIGLEQGAVIFAVGELNGRPGLIRRQLFDSSEASRKSALSFFLKVLPGKCQYAVFEKRRVYLGPAFVGEVRQIDIGETRPERPHAGGPGR